MLQYNEKQKILQNFPQIELSYEKTLHKKVHSSNIYFTIPKGPKYFAWFQNYKNNPVCLLLKLYKRKKIQDISIHICCFNDSLCIGNGTILYGTLFMNNRLFNVEDIFYFKNKDISNQNQFNKFNILNEFFKQYTKQISITNNDIIFGLPIIDTNYNNLITTISSLSYELYCIQHRLLYKKSVFLNEKIENFKQYALFFVKPEIQTDIYSLFCENNGFIEKYNYANIPDFKTSVYMNFLFRNIKENKNLDTLEESDDEEEFQNISEDKYVYLDKSFCMKCVYNKLHKRWTPLEVIDSKFSTKKKTFF